MQWYLIPVVIAAGFAAGFINVLAGSGSLITLPLLIFIGLPANIANGTNRVAILLQNVVSTKSFHDKDMLDLRGVLTLGIPAVIGSVIGAQIAVNLDKTLMERVIGVIMVIMLFVILLRPKRWLQGSREKIEGWPTFLQMVLFFLIGIYGGFIQAGVGIFLLAGLVLGVGYNLVRANAVKVGIVLVFTISALAVFIYNGQVNWIIGLVLAIGNMLGGWVATKVAVERGAVWVHRLLIAVVIVSALKLLGVFDLIGQLL
ncbi:MAG: sulfite exporter TauE/SafE family protein [Anaerolineales bacterium]|nr:sulfite exporter TauE/SafE family protein [Anaerolineales bacterium]